MPAQKLRVATCQFAESFSPRRNAAIVRHYVARAADGGADIVHFHETCLSSYLPLSGAPEKLDWPALREAAESICNEARRRKIWVVVGSTHPLTPPNKPTNCLYLIGPDGKLRDRYDKRFCMADGLNYYTPGNRSVTFTLNGIRCALLICFELRFPEIYRDLLRQGVQIIFQSFHNGHMDGPGIHTQIMRQTVQAHAGMNGFWISATNSSAYFSRWPSVFVTPDGAIATSLKQNRAGMMINTVDPSQTFYDPSAPFRASAMRGQLHNGKCVRDSRLTDARHL